MRRTGLLAFVVLLVGTLCSSAFGWEFSMRGEAEWRFRYIARTGQFDLFGDAVRAQTALVNGTSIGLAGAQAGAVRLEGYSSKGSDAAYGEQRMWFYPEIKVNEAVKLRSILTFQGNVNANYLGGGANWVTNPNYSGWIMMDSRDLYSGVGLAVPTVRAFWGTIQLPMGILSIGARPAGFGMGWVLHKDDCLARSVSLIVPYGPLNLVLSQYLHSTFEYTDPNDDRNTRRTAFTIASAVDQNEVARLNSALSLVYRSGPVDTGAMFYVVSMDGRHGSMTPAGGSYQDDMTAFGFATLFAFGPTLDGLYPMTIGNGKVGMGIAYLNYSDGRFFFNSEYACCIVNVHRNGGRPISGWGHSWAAEAGLVAGPAKYALAHFFRSGHDRRGGFFGPRFPTGYDAVTNSFTSDRFDHFFARLLGGGESAISPYCFLLGLYGAGNNSLVADGSCSFEDFAGYAGRVGYSLAANLNLFASLMYARRASETASPQGIYNGSWGTANAPGNGGAFGVAPFTTTITPNVPTTDLGWEVNAGFHWQLIESVTFKAMFAYWQPGRWFKWAYRDQTVSDPTNNDFGVVNASRTISPIMAWQTNLLVEF